MSFDFHKLRAHLYNYSQSENLSSIIVEKLNKHSNPGPVLSELNIFHEDDLITVGIDFLQEKLSSLSCTSQEFNFALKILSDIEINIIEFELIEEDNQSKVKALATRRYIKGDVIEMGRGKIYDVQVKGSGAVMIAKEKYKDDIKYTFCNKSGVLSSIVATKNEHSRLQFAAKLLGKFPDKKSLDSLRRLLKHEAHFVRWEAAQAFAMIAEGLETRKMLEELSSDAHPHIRNAANKSLTKLREA